jgi:hypothetical protein
MSDRVEPSMDESEVKDEAPPLDLSALFPNEAELQELIALQGRTIAALQQRVFTLNMEIVEMMAREPVGVLIDNHNGETTTEAEPL